MNKPSILARLFRRGSESSVVGKLYAAAIGRPLLVHALMGEQLIGAYLEGAVDIADPITAPPVITDAGQVAVINISGPLVNRPMPDDCGPGPASYEALRNVFDAALADDNVSVIVMRIESPGGMASGCFDLADHIFASRGQKPIYAVVDDYAYSGGFALAAACDERWISRTGGVGSVGVVAFHKDVTGADAQAGIKITPIFAGDRKIDWNPHIALSDEAKARAQLEIDGLAALFHQSVAAYLGMDVGAVAATQAETYTGQEAIDVGFATRLGTLRDLLAELSAPQPLPTKDDVVTDDASPDEDVPAVEGQRPDDAAPGVQVGNFLPAVEATPEQMKAHAKATLALTLAASDLQPALVKALLKRDIGVDEIDAAISAAGTIADICAAAKLPEVAADYVARAVDIETVRAELTAAVADPGPDIVTALPVAGLPGGNVAASHWGETIKRFGG